MNNHEITLLETLIGITRVARKTADAEQAKVAVRYETKFTRRLAKLQKPTR